MWLINVKTLELEDFVCAPPAYAILSHTWQNGEITFQDMYRTTSEHRNTFSGFDKVRQTCRQALKDEYDYAWVDTCCINKQSSAELSEAINSMYKWYQQAEVCYAYLSDVGEDVSEEQVFKSRWWTRGWTLQELIAPPFLVFYDKSWKSVATKEQLAGEIERHTGIDVIFLMHEVPIHMASIAKRMYWASKRETSRVEDIAYCLLGLFDINMPMLYGEGHKAYHRLQMEIMKISNDQSLFAWVAPDEEQWFFSGILAASPAFFHASRDIVHDDLGATDVTFDLTQRGLRIVLPVARHVGVWKGVLACRRIGDTLNLLVLDMSRYEDGVYERMGHRDLRPVARDAVVTKYKTTTIYIATEMTKRIVRPLTTHEKQCFFIRTLPRSYTIEEIRPGESWVPKTRCIHFTAHWYQAQWPDVRLYKAVLKHSEGRSFTIALHTGPLGLAMFTAQQEQQHVERLAPSRELRCGTLTITLGRGRIARGLGTRESDALNTLVYPIDIVETPLP